MKKQNGFTLIELVIVIIVLGILAATAVPKFINLQDDARESVVKGAEAAIHSAANIVYSKAAIEGVENSSSASAAGITVVNGYPSASGLISVVELSDDFTSVATGTSPTASLAISFTGTTCTLTYTEAATSAAAYTVVNSCG
ncbi:type II secretion system protein [Moritella viscosa]|uniref:MSHA pilin protein MshA n=1 Tax=Moritella viscosa TaxID=80854 RepID=A0ABY1HD93_9GAMM|nr:type II secretion system protein [Moritella viscosa]SGY92345.1 MSHA pilin protein MshA [Moritella viscosa]SGY96805.1 MSHA pilin protein MshA [Moritella viscosa]SGY97257.1 MSHA pilin protein MshA [Moritella viscosa]SGZ03063.1 MSHA pilin protein MshA [Moritella viscosa]SHO26457.1 MSHA pilin protein MshA [Moritella viscosa]